MVRRRKQAKASGTKGDRPTLTLKIRPDTRSPLVSLPAEIQCIITSHLVQLRDLNRLSCTCKTLNAVVLPTLYSTIELKVPLRWSQLPSLENLLASSSEGLKYTRCLRIVTKQYPPEGDVHGNLDNVPFNYDDDEDESEGEATDEEDVAADVEDEEDEREEGNGQFKIFLPNKWASNALNALIRVLIVRLSPHQLHTFWWEHACSLSTLTLSLLLKHQGASMHTLNFKAYNGPWKRAYLAKPEMEGLTTLCVPELNDQHGEWPFDLVAKNHKSLRRLQIGSEVDFALEYAAAGYFDSDEIIRSEKTVDIAERLYRKFDDLNEPSLSPRSLRLESLSLVGLDVSILATASVEPVIDFSSLGMLTLESCAGLAAAFPLLIGSGAGRLKARSKFRLHTLVIRHENTTDEFQQEFETFLLSLKPLTNLHVLVEGSYEVAFELREVLKLHGKRLRSLI